MTAAPLPTEDLPHAWWDALRNLRRPEMASCIAPYLLSRLRDAGLVSAAEPPSLTGHGSRILVRGSPRTWSSVDVA